MCCISILYTSNSTLLEINLATLSRVRIFTCSIKKLKVMSHIGNSEFWEYWFEEGLSQGMTEDEAADFVSEKAQFYL